MSKAVVELGYRKYVLDTSDAVTILGVLAKAEMYETKWRKEEDGGTSHHVYPQDQDECIRAFNVLPTALYKMAQLAGKPQK